MRTKDEILSNVEEGIKALYTSPPWERHKDVILIEVLIDIRDILYSSLDSDQAARLVRLKNP